MLRNSKQDVSNNNHFCESPVAQVCSTIARSAAASSHLQPEDLGYRENSSLTWWKYGVVLFSLIKILKKVLLTHQILQTWMGVWRGG